MPTIQELALEHPIMLKPWAVRVAHDAAAAIMLSIAVDLEREAEQCGEIQDGFWPCESRTWMRLSYLDAEVAKEALQNLSADGMLRVRKQNGQAMYCLAWHVIEKILAKMLEWADGDE